MPRSEQLTPAQQRAQARGRSVANITQQAVEAAKAEIREIVRQEVVSEVNALLSQARERREEAQARRLAEQREMAPRQVSSQPDPWAGHADHDPRVMRALQEGRSGPEVASLIESIRREREAQRPRHSDVMWRTRSGEVLRDGSTVSEGPMPQRSTNPDPWAGQHEDAPEFDLSHDAPLNRGI